MNSSAISKRLSEPYNDLLSGRRWLASSPGVFFWAGEHAVLRGGLATCQHVPLRVWVGITPHTRKGDPEVLANRDPEHHLFLMPETEAHEEHFAPIANFMESASMASKLRRVAALARENGIEGEIRDPHAPQSASLALGATVAGAFSSALAGALLCAAGKLDEGKVAAWSKEEIPALLDSADTLGFRQCHMLAWKIENIIHGGRDFRIRHAVQHAAGGGPDVVRNSVQGQRDKAWPEEVRDADHGVLDKLPYGVSSERDEEGSPNSAFFDSLLVCGLGQRSPEGYRWIR